MPAAPWPCCSVTWTSPFWQARPPGPAATLPESLGVGVPLVPPLGTEGAPPPLPVGCPFADAPAPLELCGAVFAYAM